MRRAAVLLALLLVTAMGGVARAGTEEEVRALYERFVTAQNAHDLKAVRSLLWDSPQFLWVSDGRSLWGPERMIDRMAAFQEAEVWEVVPELDRAAVVPLDAATAYLHLPLELRIGAKVPGPDRLRWLVSVLCTRLDTGWRIAALFTTADKQ